MSDREQAVQGDANQPGKEARQAVASKKGLHRLPPEVQAQIAAGEVIERPAAVVKELIENALDAGADAISIEIRQGGMGLIRVSDNGSGINAEDASSILERFTTSKLWRLEDLASLRTYGFRGEALAAIAAVADVEILTRTAEETGGIRVIVRGGKKVIEPAASPVGCSVAVTDLFARVPARRKFLKSTLREAELCRNVVIRYALARPDVAFRLRMNDRQVLTTHPEPPLSRIAACLGRDVAEEMIPIRWEALDLTVRGFISRPTIGRSHRQMQFFYVNQRPIRPGFLAVALERAYARRLPEGRHPIAVLHIEVNPAYVDVNVHPTKAEVRFMHERSVFQALSQALQEALAVFPQMAETTQFSWPFEEYHMPAQDIPLREIGTGYHAETPLRAIGQLHHSYILAQSPDGLMIVDPHAAHEAVLFERLLQGDETYRVEPSMALPLTPKEAAVIGDYLDIFVELGIEIVAGQPGTYLLHALPRSLSRVPMADLVSRLLKKAESMKERDPEQIREALAMEAACTGAIKAGDILSLEQMQKLVDQLSLYWSPAVCPHGRPAFVTISLDELDRRFLRSE